MYARRSKVCCRPRPGRGQVELDVLLAVGHGDLPALGNVAGRANLGTEQALDLPDEPFPHSFVFVVDLQAEIAQHLRGAAFSDPDVDRPFIETRFRGRQPGHGRKESDPYGSRFDGDRHAIGSLARGQTERPAVEGLVVGVVELQPAGPALIVGHSFDDDFDADVAGDLAALDFANVPHVQPPPQEVGVGNRDGNEVAAVDRDPGAFLRCALSRPLLVPAPEADVPEGEGLHGRGLPGVVGADEDHRAPELDLDLVEALEVADGEPGQHQWESGSISVWTQPGSQQPGSQWFPCACPAGSPFMRRPAVPCRRPLWRPGPCP